MLARQADGSVRGFLHDFDHASSWRRFLASVNQSDQSLAAWEAYALEEYKRYMDERNRTERKNFKSRFVFFKRNANTGVDSPGPAPKEKPSVQRGPPPTPAGPADANAPRTPGVSKDAPHPPEKPKAQQLEEIKQRTVRLHSFFYPFDVTLMNVPREPSTSWLSRFSINATRVYTKLDTTWSPSIGSLSG